MIESPSSPVYPLRPDIEDYFTPAISNKLREPNRVGGGGSTGGLTKLYYHLVRPFLGLRWRNKSRSSWAADLLAADFPVVGTMLADETSAGAVVDVQRRTPSDAAEGQSRRRDEVPAIAAPSDGGERAASGSPV